LISVNERNLALRRALLKALLAIGFVLVAATTILSIREGLSPGRALMIVLLALGGNNSLLALETRQTDIQVLGTVLAVVRVLVMALAAATILDFILRQRLPMLHTRRSKRMQNHVILCGLGNVGYRVASELQRFDTEVTVVELDASGPFVHLVTAQGIPILFEDARKTEVLIKAGLERASAVIACTDNDLTNVEIALDAKEVRPDIRVVMRLFDQGLASKIQHSFDIDAAFSASALAAPAFAAAAVDPSVRDSFYVGDILFVHSAFDVPLNSSLTQLTVWDIWGRYDVNTLTVTDDSGVVNWHPSPTMHIPHNCVITVVGPYESVQHLQADHGIIDPHARVKHGVTGAESAT
jgi:voltage-gated potassium channel Kch